MKQIIIFLLLVIVGIMGYNTYSKYKRFNPPEGFYQAKETVDANYFDPQVNVDYNRAVERVNGYVAQQWSFNKIDVRAPEKDNEETKEAVNVYNELVADARRLESILAASNKMKQSGMTNADIKAAIYGGKTKEQPKSSKQEMLQKWLYTSPEDFDFGVGAQGPLVYEIQGLLNKRGDSITHDGIYRLETANAVEAFEASQGLYADGRMDLLTANALINN